MRAALARVPEKQRIVLVMHEIDGIAVRDIAEALSVPLFSLYSRLRRARRAFAKEIRRAETLSSLQPAFRPGATGVRTALLLARGEDPPPVSPAQRTRRVRRLRALLLLRGADRDHPEPTWAAAVRPARSPRRAPARLPLALGAGALVAALLSVPLLAPRPGDPVSPAPPLALRARSAPPAAAAARATIAPPRERPPRIQAGAVESPAPRLTRGLVGYWRFDETRGSASARDISGQGNDCLLRRLDSDRAWGDGALAGALALTGKGWLECPVTGALAALTSEITIAAWVTRGVQQRNYHALVARQKDAGRQDEFMFGFNNGQLLFSSHVWWGQVVHPLPPGNVRWLHVAVTRQDDGTTILFVDGVPVRRGQTGRGTLPSGGNPLILGAAVNGQDPGRTEARFDGAVDELVIYDRALSPAEVEALAAAHQPQVPLQ